MLIISVEDAMSNAVEICDTSYGRMTAIIETPVFIDTPEVRSMINELTAVRDSVHMVANVMLEPYGGVINEVNDDAV